MIKLKKKSYNGNKFYYNKYPGFLLDTKEYLLFFFCEKEKIVVLVTCCYGWLGFIILRKKEKEDFYFN